MNKEMCVEFWKNDRRVSGSWAQMSENIPYKEPDPKDVSRRYFPNRQLAMEFAKNMCDQGYLTKVY